VILSISSRGFQASLRDAVHRLFAQLLRAPFRGGDANHRRAENATRGHREERWKNHPVDQIAGYAEDDQCISRQRAAIAIVHLSETFLYSSACSSL
jgi:hypothetical protein